MSKWSDKMDSATLATVTACRKRGGGLRVLVNYLLYIIGAETMWHLCIYTENKNMPISLNVEISQLPL